MENVMVRRENASVDLGFSGRPGTVQNWAGQQRKSNPNVTASPAMPATLSPEPSARQTARMLMADPTGLSQPEQSFVSRVLAHVPDLVNSITVAKRLSSPLRRKSTEDLEGLLAAAADTSLTEFAAGLRRDIGAVQASLDLPWTTSPAEGQINRLKMLKRTMYGRAGFALLRARVLDAA
jgi:transposase